MRKNIARRLFLISIIILIVPMTARADFSAGEIPQFVQDQSPLWLFEILSALLLAVFQLFFGGLFGLTTTTT